MQTQFTCVSKNAATCLGPVISLSHLNSFTNLDFIPLNKYLFSVSHVPVMVTPQDACLKKVTATGGRLMPNSGCVNQFSDFLQG